MKRLFCITTQPTLKMYRQLNKMNVQRFISMKVLVAVSCIFGVMGVLSIINYNTISHGISKGILSILINVAVVLFYFKGHELLAEKSMRLQGKDAYLEIYYTFYDDRVNVRTKNTKGSIPTKRINGIREDSQYYYISYDKVNMAKSYIVIDKDGFTLGDKLAFKDYIIDLIRKNKAEAKILRKSNSLK